MRSFDLRERQERLRSDRRRLLEWARLGLAFSALLLAIAPLFVDPSYSIATETLSQAGGQGIEGAWVHRLGVGVAGMSVLLMVAAAEPSWGRWARRWMVAYTLALVMLIGFPASPWTSRPFDMVVSTLHTAAAVTGGIAFILGVVAVSLNRPPNSGIVRTFDWVVVASIALIPQLMLRSDFPGLLQRIMVILGYAWLMFESIRLARPEMSSSHQRSRE